VSWTDLDVRALLAIREATLSGNAGAYPTPFGQVISRYPSPREREYDPPHYQSYADWAKRR
jgi:hypothetical protein